MRVISTDILGSLAVFFDRDIWGNLDLGVIPDDAECHLEIDYPGGGTLHTSVGALRKARKAYSVLKSVWESDRDIRRTVREEVYTIFDEFRQTMKGENNE